MWFKLTQLFLWKVTPMLPRPGFSHDSYAPIDLSHTCGEFGYSRWLGCRREIPGKTIREAFSLQIAWKNLYVITTLQINAHDLKHDGMYAKYNKYIYNIFKIWKYKIIYMDYILYESMICIHKLKPSKLDRCTLYHTCTYVIHSLLEFSTPIWVSKWFTWGISWMLTWNWQIDIFIVYTGNEKYMAQPRHIGLYGAFKLY